MKQVRLILEEIGNGLFLSYPQIFFSRSYLFSAFLIVITLLYPTLGLSGILCTLSALTFAKIIGLPSEKIRSGYYGYNALLVGLGLGSFYQWNLPLGIILVFSGFLTLLIHATIEGFFTKYQLPILSYPFLFSLWLVELSSKNLFFLIPSEHSVYLLNNLFYVGGITFVQWYDSLTTLWLPSVIKFFFTCLASIFFLDNAFAGLVLFTGLLIFSRIAASLSILGFMSAYGFMSLVGMDTSQMSLFFVGFNFILTAIAIGGTFIIPSIYSYLWVIFLSPLVVLLTFGFGNLLAEWQLSVYSLPFNLAVSMFLFVLYFRTNPRKKIAETIFQEYMPEKNLYSYLNFKKRFGTSIHKVQIMLPFWGEWTVSQGYDGEITHKDSFRHALDFVITYNGKTYKGTGNQLADYYCYNKLVLSPGYGTVVKVIDNIDDNQIGDVNTMNNWGNTIVIQHTNFLYSQLSHLKAGSIKVREGDYVKTGQPIAQVGNSGRSPEPHLHFQLQHYPHVGSPTVEYPFSRYVLKILANKELKFNSIPQKGEVVENPTINSTLYKAFHFIPGQQIDILQTTNNQTKTFRWEVFTDSLNNSYFYCHTTRSYAYFHNDGLSFLFNSFSGDKKSPLYLFYLSCYHIEFSSLSNFTLHDEFPQHHIFSFSRLFLHDIFAPFFQFIKASYCLNINQLNTPISELELKSKINYQLFHKRVRKINSNIIIDTKGLQTIEALYNKTSVVLRLILKDRYE